MSYLNSIFFSFLHIIPAWTDYILILFSGYQQINKQSTIKNSWPFSRDTIDKRGAEKPATCTATPGKT
jgi:hypothetical protein